MTDSGEVEAQNSFVLEGTLCIPAPMRSSYRRGMNSDKKADGPTSFRLPKGDIALIDEAAKVLGMKRSELVRWVTYYAANDIVKSYKAWQKQQ